MPHLPSLCRYTRAALAAAALVALAACGGGAPPPQAGGPPPAVPVEFLTLEPQAVERVGEFVGVVRSRQSLDVLPQAEGFLTAVHARAGMRVARGTPLFEIDAATQQAALASLEAQRRAREIDAALARQEVGRVRQLVEAGAVSQQAVDQAVAASDAADAQVQVIADQIEQQRAELAYHEVVAPAAGTIGDVSVTVGDRVTRGTVLTSLEAAGGLEVYVNVPVQQATALRPDLPVRLVDDAGTVIGETAVSFIAASVDDATQSVLVLAPVPPGADLRADQYVRAHLVWADEAQLRVPVLAAQRFGGQFFVFVAEATPDGSVARQRPVTLGPIVDDTYPVIAGLMPGEVLIVAGTQKIGDGMPVQALPPMPPPGAGAGAAPGAVGQ